MEAPIRIHATVHYISGDVTFSTLSYDTGAWMKRVMADHPLALGYDFLLT